MKTIHTLSPLVVSKIAAGEVIERPSYAIKELIENALDANATEIKIYLEEAGLQTLQVIDNGKGMSPEDVEDSWKPHTTSKITHEDELHNIRSFGFRGEALSSLAAVSTLTIQSRTKKNQTGCSVVIDNGVLKRTSVIGMSEGTIIKAEGLFERMPARKKFLKSVQTELRLSIDVVNHYAMAYPAVLFTLIHGKKTILSYPATDDVSERVEQVIGSDMFSFFIPIKKDETYISVRGFIAKPQAHASNLTRQYLFVNTRKVTDKLVSAAVKEAYGTMLESASYPIFVLFVTVPYELVDINVHPRKEQVSFADSRFMFQTMKQVVGDVLEEHNLTFQNLSWKKTGAGTASSVAGKLLKDTVLSKEAFVVDSRSSIFQFHKLYIVVSTKQQLMVVDQHAAHERILFEKLKKDLLLQQKKRILYTLPKPLALRLTVKETIAFAEYHDVFERLGFIQEKKKLTKVPSLFRDRDPQEFIQYLLEEVEQKGETASIDRVSEEMIAFLACRAAVKAGDTLTEKQMRNIVNDLSNTLNNATCPHGRPTTIAMSIEELHGMFKRS
jgi:DNA mismatch repair protein MutL